MRFRKEDKAGIYGTVIFHLAVLVILLVCQIGYSLRGENTFVLDFSKQEEVERIKQEEMFKEDISSRIDELLAASAAGQISVRNVAVDRSALRDDRGTDAQKLYEDAARLQQELESGFELPKPEDGLASVQDSRLAGAGITRYFEDVFISERIGCHKPRREFFVILGYGRR